MRDEDICYTIESFTDTSGAGSRRTTRVQQGQRALLTIYSAETLEARGAHWRAVMERLSLEMPPATDAQTPTQTAALAKLVDERDAALAATARVQEEVSRVRRLLAGRGWTNNGSGSLYDQVQSVLVDPLAQRAKYDKLLSECLAHQDAIDLLETKLQEAHAQVQKQHRQLVLTQTRLCNAPNVAPPKKRPSARRK